MTFRQRALEAIKRLLSSGKVYTAIVGLIVTVAARHSIVLVPDDVSAVLAIFAVLIGAQGAADFGKGAAQVQAANPPPPEAVQSNVVNVASEKRG